MVLRPPWDPFRQFRGALPFTANPCHILPKTRHEKDNKSGEKQRQTFWRKNKTKKHRHNFWRQKRQTFWRKKTNILEKKLNFRRTHFQWQKLWRQKKTIFPETNDKQFLFENEIPDKTTKHPEKRDKTIG